jgi:hypothetical protein
MYIVFFLIAFAGFIGVFLLSEATLGVGIIAAGCLAGIIARIFQAEKQQQELRRQLENKV